jgi:putative endonuclease
MKSLKNKTYNFGILAEKIVILFLIIKGYKILKWRYKTHCGEIDIIARKFHSIIFIEVKARKTKSNIEEILLPRQIQRIKKTAEIFMAKNSQFSNYQWRFDFIEVSRFFFVKHYHNFF